MRPYGPQAPKLLCPWDSPGKNSGVGCHFLLQGIFPTQGSNPGLLHCRQILYHWATGDALQFCREIKSIKSWNISVFIFSSCLHCCRASQVAQLVKNGKAGKESACSVGDLGSIPGLGRFGEGNSYPFQHSDLENSTDYSMGLQKTWLILLITLSLSLLAVWFMVLSDPLNTCKLDKTPS